MKVTRLMFYEPWSWIIGAGSYEEEFYQARTLIANTGARGNVVLALVGGIGVVLAFATWFFVAREISGKIMRIVMSLTQGSEQTAAAAGQVSSASQSLAQGASEQAAAIEETSSSVEEMTGMTRQNAAHAEEAKTLAVAARNAANAEESASAGEELSAQAEELNNMVRELLAMVGGGDAKAAGSGTGRGAEKNDAHFTHGAAEALARKPAARKQHRIPGGATSPARGRVNGGEFGTDAVISLNQRHEDGELARF